MKASDEQFSLGHTADWIVLGIVTVADIASDQLECATSDDPHPEHYRWRAFRRFIATQQPLSPAVARQLYALGNNDADSSMSGSVMAEILRHPDCHPDLLHLALTSKHKHLRRIAAEHGLFSKIREDGNDEKSSR